MAQINKPSEYFNTKLYSGTGSAQDITGLDFQPDFNWIKRRNTTGSHRIQDSIRGTTNYLQSDKTDAEASGGDVDAFLSNGFSLDGGATAYNASGSTYASWNWLGANGTASNTDGSITSTVSVNTTSGFSIVSYTGNATLGATVGHGLGSDCKLMIIKNRSISSNWIMYHPVTLENRYMELNTTNAEAINFDYWDSTRPTSSVFTIGTANTVNGSGNSMIAYCFAEKKGFSKFGGYTGNGSTDGTFVYTGFKPALVILKRTDSSGTDWNLVDNKRAGFNPDNYFLAPNSSGSENSVNDIIDLLSNGFKLTSASGASNTSGGSYIYMAFAENPLVGTNNIPATAR